VLPVADYFSTACATTMQALPNDTEGLTLVEVRILHGPSAMYRWLTASSEAKGQPR
jgi:hypothetical protein